MPIKFYTDHTILPKQIKKKLISEWINEIIYKKEKKPGKILYIFCSDKQIRKLNRQYLQHDYYTDIITFDYSTMNELSGELYVSLDTVKTNAVKFNTNYMEELYRVLIHGILHLCGINDKTAADQIKMKEEENKAIEILMNKLKM